MTPRLTAKEVRRRYPHIIDGGNINWPCLPKVCQWEKVGYNTGRYGWNFDVYEVTKDTCVVAGDRAIDGNLAVDPDRMDGYEIDAQDIRTIVRFRKEYGRRSRDLRCRVMRYLRTLEETADARGT